MAFWMKRMFFWVVFRLDQMLPPSLGVLVRNRTWPWGRPVLDAVELHVTDHCNMNCTGCSHFSPFSPKWFADIPSTLRDLKALRARFRRIRHVNLLGGEPLLHPRCGDLVAGVRSVCPDAVITVVTNGLALRPAQDGADGPSAVAAAFLSACRESRARVKWTLYPPMRAFRRQVQEMFRKAGVSLRIEEGDEFWARLVPEGNVDVRKAFRFCRRMMYCPYLRDGHLYTCAQAYHLKDVAAKAGFAAPPAGGMDVYDDALTGREMLRRLMSPCAACAYCADSVRLMRWSRGGTDAAEWMRRDG